MSVETTFLDTSSLPIARLPSLPANQTATDAWLADMESLLGTKSVFVLVYDPIRLDPSAKDDHDNRKKTILWLKKNRDAFQTYCKGMVLTCADDLSDKPFLEANIGPLSKAYGIPGRIANTKEEADKIALELASA